MSKVDKMQEEIAQTVFSEPFHLCTDWQQRRVNQAVEVAKYYLTETEGYDAAFREYEQARERFQTARDNLVEMGVLARPAGDLEDDLTDHPWYPSSIAQRILMVALRKPTQDQIEEAAEIVIEAMKRAALKKELRDR